MEIKEKPSDELGEKLSQAMICDKCGGPNELYMLKTSIWLQINEDASRYQDIKRYICMTCAEDILGREITSFDLNDARCNKALKKMFWNGYRLGSTPVPSGKKLAKGEGNE